MDIRRTMMGVIAGMAGSNNVKTGTFVGDGTNAIAIPCPFNPDIIDVWCDDLKTNPGVATGGLISCFMLKNFCYNTFRYTSATSSQAAGGKVANPIITYNNGIYTFYSQSDVASFYPVNGYTYHYALVKL